MIEKPHTFAHFPQTTVCPVCGTAEDAQCVLIPIDGKISEAIPVHLWCAVANRYARPEPERDAIDGPGLLYRWCEYYKESCNG